ncbi:hypothetical protein DSO57_1021259 [Entomophthora muscae]|uniref:Uncharacterized protein n=1 Tax=Entomophthora muscae TaxID=34485 RepID=A0ACC2RI11_9FUNG|nr:hypothetical protein DSO57_1021259 [Entomophthora muscae]
MKALTPLSSKAATFIDTKAALLGAVRPHRQMNLALKSSIHNAHIIPELVKQFCSFKDDFEPPVPEARSRTKDDPWPRILVTEPQKESGSPTETRSCYKCNQHGHLSRDCLTKPKYHTHHAEKEDDPKKLLSSQEKEIFLTAAEPNHSLNPYFPPIIPPNPDLIVITNAVDIISVFSGDNQEASDLFLPDPEEVEENLLHKVLVVNTITRTQILRQNDTNPKTAKEVVSPPSQNSLFPLTLWSPIRVTLQKKVATLLKSGNLTASLNSIANLNPELKDSV